MSRICVLSFLFLSHLLHLISAAKCPTSFSCEAIENIQFPFTTAERPDCGIVAVRGCNNPDPVANKTVEIRGRSFNVVSSDNLTIAIQDSNLHNYLKSENCSVFQYKVLLPPPSPLSTFAVFNNITIYRCKRTLNINLSKPFQNYSKCPDYNIFYYCSSTGRCPGVQYHSSLAACSRVELPTKDMPDTNHPFTFLTSEIQIRAQLSDDCVKCINQERGRCQLDNRGIFHCFKAGDKRWVWKQSLGIVAAAVVVVMIFVCCLRKQCPLLGLLTFEARQNPTNKIIEAFLHEHGHLPTRRYTYSEIKEATNSFTNKLGQGGFGCVYKGKLHDGRKVAVKVLSELKGNGAEFINEVASISRTSHVNIVSLLGFCFQGSKRALIYEFMPNGSLEKFIYEENAKIVNRQLDCETLFNIAIGVARGLEYLHRGCNTKILHMNIKPHNILLDKDFSPKISDFGLAKICQRQNSFVSITGARGTIGYIAPEVFSRNFGEVSHKSDVYSYGMMILEMVGGRKNINVKVDCSSEIYFPHWVYGRIELNQELELWCVKNQVDKERARKMLVVGLWCIQTDPKNRPAMSKVMDMLEGNIDSLEVPPKPFLTSPPTSPSHHSIQTS